jgi:hypothetical protein
MIYGKWTSKGLEGKCEGSHETTDNRAMKLMIEKVIDILEPRGGDGAKTWSTSGDLMAPDVRKLWKVLSSFWAAWAFAGPKFRIIWILRCPEISAIPQCWYYIRDKGEDTASFNSHSYPKRHKSIKNCLRLVNAKRTDLCRALSIRVSIDKKL